MSGNKNILIDTNIAIYLLKGDEGLRLYEDYNYWISEITEMELLGVKDITSERIQNRKAFIENCSLTYFNDTIKSIAIGIKQKRKIKLPDAIILATSIYLSIPLVTADKDLANVEDAIVMIYQPST